MSYLGPRKLYIDSRARSSGSHSDFTYQLAQSIEVPHGMVAIIDTVSVPNTFMTIDATRVRASTVIGHTGGDGSVGYTRPWKWDHSFR